MSQSRRTLNTLIRLGRALREDAQSPEATQSPLRAAGQAAAARVTPTLQDAAGRLRAGAQGLRDQVQARADDRLERLITERHPGGPSDPEARAVLARRREAREARAAQAQARAGLLAQAQTPSSGRCWAWWPPSPPGPGASPARCATPPCWTGWPPAATPRARWRFTAPCGPWPSGRCWRCRRTGW
ncbi:hypothetical protein [Deinococcus multiflagellatus]|uniref:Uncharacterized protein n=1 Tax=Deinococcus multiflagellatus TaxID=1656887 RepID=A0ABW1ZLC9_9DEIO